MIKKSNKVSIYRFTDYRAFLASYFTMQKEAKPYFSHRYFCTLAGFKTPSVIKLVIDGKRNLTHTSIVKVAKAIGLCNHEQLFFETLVRYNQEKDAAQKRDFFFKLEELRGTSSPELVEATHYAFYKEWFIPVVRECLAIAGVSQSPGALAQRIVPRISSNKVQESISLMESLGLIAKDKRGRYQLRNQTITTPSEVDSDYIAHFNREMIRLAQHAALCIPKQQREISGITLRISKKCFDEVKQRIVNFKKELLHLAAKDIDSDMVYQCNIQLFPLIDKE